MGIAILDLLMEHPMHPYEMRQTIRQRHIDHHVKVRGGSLYHTVDRLVAAGLIEPVETERQGRRPERTVYRITGAGRDELVDWLDEALADVRNEFPQFVGALAFMHNFSPARAARLLRDRSVRLMAEIAALDRTLEGAAENEVARAHLVEWEFHLAMRRAELAWVEALQRDIIAGRLTWTPHFTEATEEEEGR